MRHQVYKQPLFICLATTWQYKVRYTYLVIRTRYRQKAFLCFQIVLHKYISSRRFYFQMTKEIKHTLFSVSSKRFRSNAVGRNSESRENLLKDTDTDPTVWHGALSCMRRRFPCLREHGGFGVMVIMLTISKLLAETILHMIIFMECLVVPVTQFSPVSPPACQ